MIQVGVGQNDAIKLPDVYGRQFDVPCLDLFPSLENAEIHQYVC